MPKAAPQPSQSPQTEPYFSGYVYTSGDAALTFYNTAAEFAAAMAAKSAQGVVVYIAPAHVIACLMQDGAAPAAAQDMWHSHAAPYVAMLRKLRRRLTLIQLPSEEAASAVQAVIEERLPEAAASALPDLPIAPELTEPFWQALAQLHISQTVQTSDMIDILHSHSTGAVDTPEVPDIASVLYDRWRAREAQTGKHHAEATTQNAMLVEQIMALEQDLAGIHDTLETAMHDQQAHVQELVAQIDAYAQMVQTLTAARDTSQQALEAAAAQIKANQATQADMQSRIDKKNKQIGTLTAERNWVRDKRKEHEEEAAAHKKSLAQLEDEKKSLETLLAEKSAEFDTQKSHLEAAMAEKSAELDAQKNHLEAALAEHTTALGQARETLIATQNDQQTLLTERDTLKEQMQAELAAKTAALALADENHREMSTQMSTQICQLEEAVRFSYVEHSDNSNDTAKEALRQMVRQLEISLSMLQSRQRDIQADRDSLQAQLDSLHTSTSWRVTGPMRSVSRLVRK